MIYVMVMQEFDRKLGEVSGLMQSMDSNSYHFQENAITLVLEMEKLAEKYGLPIQAELALVRGKLACGYPEEKANLLSRKDRSREKQRYIIGELSKGVELVKQYFEAARKQFDSCEQVCGQMIINAYYKGLNKQKEDLFVLVSQDTDLGPHLAEVYGSVGCANAKVIFEQAKKYLKFQME